MILKRLRRHFHRTRRFPALFTALTFFATIFGLAIGSPAYAQSREVPYWASIRAQEANMRVGPDNSYRISWVYKRKHLPVKVLRIKEGWRLIEDPDGERGWIYAQLLSKERSALVTGTDLAEIRKKPNGVLLWRVEPGVVGMLEGCKGAWCEVNISGHSGYIESARLWGVGAP